MAGIAGSTWRPNEPAPQERAGRRARSGGSDGLRHHGDLGAALTQADKKNDATTLRDKAIDTLRTHGWLAAIDVLETDLILKRY
ncbi:hypothetical protein [Nocardia altamirensis]|uniref:hypothetical protein n=1 Tax=Nocardia altamirensis TaxID=472158 RepID=UPI0008404B8C|nr:hypothetical protein [Nocardia altamirensis]